MQLSQLFKIEIIKKSESLSTWTRRPETRKLKPPSIFTNVKGKEFLICEVMENRYSKP